MPVSVTENRIIAIVSVSCSGVTCRKTSPSSVNFNAMLGIVLMMLVLGWAFWYLLPVSTYNKAATFRDNIRLHYNDEGMAIQTGVGERQLSWRNFNQIVETDSFFYLYRDKRSFFLIPTSAFQSSEAHLQFRELMQRAIPDYRRKDKS